MKVLFGIPTSGRNELAEKSVRSAFQQSRMPDEVRVVEDCGVSKPFQWTGNENVVVTRNQVRSGPIVGRNQMMLETDADIFIGLDDDSYFIDSDLIEQACAVFEEKPRAGALYFEVLMEGDEQRKERGPLRQVRTFVGCGCALRIQAVKEVGGYEKLPGLFYGEESDLSIRLLDKGWETWKVPGYHVWHARTFRQRTKRDRADERMWGTMNDLAFILRRCPGWLMLPYMLGNLANQILFSLKNPDERLGPTLRGAGKFLFKLPKVWSTRRPVCRETWNRHRTLL